MFKIETFTYIFYICLSIIYLYIYIYQFSDRQEEDKVECKYNFWHRDHVNPNRLKLADDFPSIDLHIKPLSLILYLLTRDQFIPEEREILEYGCCPKYYNQEKLNEILLWSCKRIYFSFWFSCDEQVENSLPSQNIEDPLTGFRVRKQWCFLLGNLFGGDLVSGLGIKVLLASNFDRKLCLASYPVVACCQKMHLSSSQDM